MHQTNITLEALSGGQSSKTALTTTSAQLPVVSQPATLPAGAPIRCALVLDAAGFVRRGTNPTAVVDSDQYIPANTIVTFQVMAGERLAVVLPTGTGNAYFTPNV